MPKDECGKIRIISSLTQIVLSFVTGLVQPDKMGAGNAREGCASATKWVLIVLAPLNFTREMLVETNTTQHRLHYQGIPAGDRPCAY
jgi:hypothetical protein